MKPKTYCCSDCQIYFIITIVPPPSNPSARPIYSVPECCPFCGDSICFDEVCEVDE